MSEFQTPREILGERVVEQILDLHRELDETRARLKRLLEHVGTRSVCHRCGQLTFEMRRPAWITRGRHEIQTCVLEPYEPNGTPHRCPCLDPLSSEFCPDPANSEKELENA